MTQDFNKDKWNQTQNINC